MVDEESLLVARLRAAGCVFAEDEAELLREAAVSPAQLELFVTQREKGLPIEHIVGWALFCGVRIPVDPGVFVPRPRSEFLVAAARSRVRARSVVLDLCCGSGAIGVAVASGVTVELVAADIDPVAVVNARRTVEKLGGRVFESDLFDGLPPELGGTVKVITVIAPYVPTAAIALLPHEARDFEHLSALDGGLDGLDIVRRIIAEAPQWLAPGGTLLTEVSEVQIAVVLTAVEAAGLRGDVEADEELDSWVVTATR